MGYGKSGGEGEGEGRKGRTVSDESPNFSSTVVVQDLSCETDGSSCVDEIIDEDGDLSRCI